MAQGRKVATVRALRSDEIEASLNNSAIAIDRDPFYGKIGRLHDEETARVQRISRVSTGICRLDLDETLTAMKEMNMPRCAEYAERLGLTDEPAFSHWVKFALKKRDRLLKKVFRRKRSNRFKYGIAVPRTVKEAYALDKANGNDSWAKAIKKEMSNVMIAF